MQKKIPTRTTNPLFFYFVSDLNLLFYSASDCLEIGRVLAKPETAESADSWLKEAYTVWKKEDDKTLTKVEMLEGLAVNYNRVSPTGFSL